jgi:hypothetical protein
MMNILIKIIGFLALSYWIGFIISVGVSIGIKSAYEDFQKKRRKER